GRERRGACLLPGVPGADRRPRAAPVDHGLRPGAAGDARVETPPVPTGGGGGVAAVLRARRDGDRGAIGARREGVRACGAARGGLTCPRQYGKRAPRAPHPPPLYRSGECSRVPKPDSRSSTPASRRGGGEVERIPEAGGVRFFFSS